MASDATIHEPHGLSMGVYRFFGDIGFVLGPIVLGVIADGYGLKLPFYCMSAIMIINGFLVLVFARETFRRRNGEKEFQVLVE